MRSLLFITIILSIFSCRVFQKSTNEENKCSTLKMVIEEIWEYDAKNDIHKISNLDLFKQHKDCLIGMSETEIIDLLGKPNVLNKEVQTFFWYNMHIRCNDRPRTYCEVCDIRFDDKLGTANCVEIIGFTMN